MPRPLRPPRLERRPDGQYVVVWYDRDAKQTRRISLATTDAADAERRFATFLLDRRESLALTGAGVLTIGAALDLYYEEHVLGLGRDGSRNVIDRERIEITIRNLKLWFAGRAVQEISKDLVDAYSQKRAAGVLGYAQGGQSAPRQVKDGTIRRELQTLVAALHHNRKAGRIAAVPAVDVGKQPEPRFRVLTQDEWQRLLAAAALTGHDLLRLEPLPDARLTRLYRFLMIALHAPARRRSIEGLMWSQVDRKARLIHFNPAGARQSNKRKPTLPIADRLWPVLERAFAEKTSLYVLDHPGEIRTTFERAVERAGLAGTGVLCHTLRHTYATWALAAGVPIWKVAGMLGDSIKTVERNYGHHHPDYLREAANFGAPADEAGEG